MDKFEFQNVGTILYRFIWEDFCDKYIEMAKFHMSENTTKLVLRKVLVGILKMLHPFMPFVTEEIYQKVLETKDTIMLSDYPKYDKKEVFKDVSLEVEDEMEFIRLFRNMKAEHNIGKEYHVLLNNKEDYTFIMQMLKITDHIASESQSENKYEVVYKNYNMTLCDEKEESKEDIKKKKKKYLS
mgnify:FL=1